jgi:hypothetical protein
MVMKKSLFFIPIISCALLSIGFALSTPYIQIIVNSKPVDMTGILPFIENGRTYVPVRSVLESYGVDSIEWNSPFVMVKKSGVTLRIKIGENHILRNDVPIIIDAPATIKNNRTYIPIRAVIEALGGAISWDSGNRSVIIESGISGFDGTIIDGKREGYGTYIFKNGDKYVGEFRNDLFNGNGVFIWNDGARYDGQWKNGLKNGEGDYILKNGEVLKGIWTEGELTRILNDIRTFVWTYDKRILTWNLDIDAKAYEYFKSLPRPSSDFSVCVSDTADDVYISHLINLMKNIQSTYGFSDRDFFNCVVSFVQSIKYTTDLESTGSDEYPKFPLETLYDRHGDCEDKSILLAALLTELGYDTVLVGLVDHMGVGVNAADISGSYFAYNGIKYYYIETTYPGWKPGVVPDEYASRPATIYSLEKKPIIGIDWTSDSTTGNSVIRTIISNDGSESATGINVHWFFDRGDDTVYSQTKSGLFDLPPHSKIELTATLPYPYARTRLVVRVVQGDTVLFERYSNWSE